MRLLMSQYGGLLFITPSVVSLVMFTGIEGWSFLLIKVQFQFDGTILTEFFSPHNQATYKLLDSYVKI